MDIAGDAGAFAFDSVLPFQLLHFPAQAPQAEVADSESDGGNGDGDREHLEPPGFVEMRQDGNFKPAPCSFQMPSLLQAMT